MIRRLLKDPRMIEGAIGIVLLLVMAVVVYKSLNYAVTGKNRTSGAKIFSIPNLYR